MYFNLVSKFFSGGKLITSRPERIKKCFEYVMNEKYYKTQRSRDFITKKITSVEDTFMKKWRLSKCRELEPFKKDNEAWMHISLKVQVKHTFFSSKLFYFILKKWSFINDVPNLNHSFG